MGLKMSARVIRIILCILFLEENENLHPVLFSLGFGVRKQAGDCGEINKLRQRS